MFVICFRVFVLGPLSSNLGGRCPLNDARCGCEISEYVFHGVMEITVFPFKRRSIDSKKVAWLSDVFWAVVF
jgi:hypothetical protein